MSKKPSYEELEAKVSRLEQEMARSRPSEKVPDTEEVWQLLKGAPFGIYLIDMTGKLVAANRRGAERLGKIVDEALGTTLREYFPPDVSENRRMKGMEAVMTGRPVNFEDQVQGRCYEVTICPLSNDRGKPTHLAIYGVDITERRLTEDALRQKTEELDRFFTRDLDLLCIADTDGVFRTLNPLWGKTLGYPIRELEGYRFLDLVHPDDLDRTREAVHMLRDQKEVVDFTNRYRCKDGTYRWIEWRSFLSGNLIYASARDITKQKGVEEALRESEEKYRLLVENANDAIFIAQDGVLKFPNPKCLKVTGYTAEELSRKPFVELVHPEDRDTVLASYQRRMQGKSLPDPHSFRVVNRSGEVFLVEINAVRITWEGRLATLNFVRDITAQRKLEAQFQAVQRLKSLGTLAGGIAHDFNNVLMGIQGRTSLMLTDMRPDHPHFEYLVEIEDQVRSGADLTRQILGFARAGKYEVKPSDLNEIVEKSSAMFSRTKKEIQIHSKYQDAVWTVEVDQGQIQQVLMNLYVNAWQAMPGGGDLYLETANVVLDEDDVQPFGTNPGRYVKVGITDTGTGMDEKTRARIFEPFFTTKEMGRGTGLGLATVYGIVKNHGGIINVYSERGQGTSFSLYLPASEKKPAEVPKSEDAPLRGTGTILLVDDEATILEVGVRMLKKLGYRVLSAQGGTEALKTFEDDPKSIDLVILDMIMPDMGGEETFERLKKVDPRVRVLLSSGYSIDGQAQKILDRGCRGFLQKPFSLNDMSSKVREVLEKPPPVQSI